MPGARADFLSHGPDLPLLQCARARAEGIELPDGHAGLLDCLFCCSSMRRLSQVLLTACTAQKIPHMIAGGCWCSWGVGVQNMAREYLPRSSLARAAGDGLLRLQARSSYKCHLMQHPLHDWMPTVFPLAGVGRRACWRHLSCWPHNRYKLSCSHRGRQRLRCQVLRILPALCVGHAWQMA